MAASETVFVESPAVQAPVVTPPSVTTRDVLHRAADLLEEFGWCQGYEGSKDRGEFCAGGALKEAMRELRFHDRAGIKVPLAAVGFSVGEGDFAAWDVPDWNDAPGRTRDEVVARLREAAERSEHVGGDR